MKSPNSSCFLVQCLVDFSRNKIFMRAFFSAIVKTPRTLRADMTRLRICQNINLQREENFEISRKFDSKVLSCSAGVFFGTLFTSLYCNFHHKFHSPHALLQWRLPLYALLFLFCGDLYYKCSAHVWTLTLASDVADGLWAEHGMGTAHGWASAAPVARVERTDTLPFPRSAWTSC